MQPTDPWLDLIKFALQVLQDNPLLGISLTMMGVNTYALYVLRGIVRDITGRAQDRDKTR